MQFWVADKILEDKQVHLVRLMIAVALFMSCSDGSITMSMVFEDTVSWHMLILVV